MQVGIFQNLISQLQIWFLSKSGKYAMAKNVLKETSNHLLLSPVQPQSQAKAGCAYVNRGEHQRVSRHCCFALSGELAALLGVFGFFYVVQPRLHSVA